MTTFPDCPKCKKPILPNASTYLQQNGFACLCDTMPPKDTRMPVQATETPKGPSDLEELYLSLLREYAPDIPPPLQQQELIPGRKFTCDFVWPVQSLVVEIEGACHRTEQRFYSDAEKQCLLTIHGWKVLRFTGRMLRHRISDVVAWTRQGLERGKG